MSIIQPLYPQHEGGASDKWVEHLPSTQPVVRLAHPVGVVDQGQMIRLPRGAKGIWIGYDETSKTKTWCLVHFEGLSRPVRVPRGYINAPGGA